MIKDVAERGVNVNLITYMSHVCEGVGCVILGHYMSICLSTTILALQATRQLMSDTRSV